MKFTKVKINFFFLPIGASLLLCLIILILFNSLPSQLPLFYSRSWGELQLVGKQQLFVIPAASVLINLINLGLSKQLHPHQSFFKKMLLLSSQATTLVLVITFIKIVNIFL